MTFTATLLKIGINSVVLAEKWLVSKQVTVYLDEQGLFKRDLCNLAGDSE